MNNRGFWQFFLENWRFTYVLMGAILLMGLISAVQIPKESNPQVTIPFVVVSVPFPGASAEDVEEFVVKPIEDKVLGLSDLEQVNSTATNSFASIGLEFKIGIDIDQAVNDVKSKVDLAKSELPSQVEDPIVQKVSFSDEPILRIALSGPYSVTDLTSFANDLKEDIERVNGVSEVDVIGGQNRELRILVDKSALDRYGLPLIAVTQAIRAANSNIPVGQIETSGENYNIQFAGRVESTQEVASLPITSINNVPILISDVAQIEDNYEEASSLSVLSLDGHDPQPSITLKIKKVDGGNVIQTVEKVWQVINEQKLNLPDQVIVETIEDNAEFIRQDLTDLSQNGLQTVIIVMILLFIFLGFREALLAGLGIPVAFLITFAVLVQIGYTLNFMTLFSLILALGIIVDASIVMTEGIHWNIHKGMPKKEAASVAIKQFSLPLISGTFTTIFAFLPMMMTSGIIGEFIKSIPVTVSTVLTGSLFVALAIIPAIGFKWLKVKNSSSENKGPSFRDKMNDFLRLGYKNLLDTFIEFKHVRVLTWLILPVVFFGSLALPASGILEVNMFPTSDQDRLYINVEAPIGTPLFETDELMRPIKDKIQKDDRVESFSATVGSSGENTGSLVVNLKEERDTRSLTILDEYTASFQKLSKLDVSIYQLDMGPDPSAPVEVRVVGPELETIDSLARDFETYLSSVEGTRDVRTNIEETNGQFEINIDRAKASIYGVSASDIALTLRNAVHGSTATTITEGDDDVDVNVKFKLNNPGELEDQIEIGAVEALTIDTNVGKVPLKSFVDFSFGGSRASIQHRDGDRIAIVSSQLQEGYTAQTVFLEVQDHIDQLQVPDGYAVTAGGEREDIDQSFQDLFRAMILGIFMIAALLVWQFRSFRQPLFILVTIPLALIGVLPGLVIVGQPLSFPGMIGVVALAGIVVNNAIILVDRINYHRMEGEAKQEAVISASLSRLQPILLTTVTTVAGILPLTLSNESWGPLGFSIIFGLLFSTVLTLFVVPLLYLRFGEKQLNGEHEEPLVCPIPKISLLN